MLPFNFPPSLTAYKTQKETLEYSNQTYNRINAHPFMFVPTSCDSKRYLTGSLSNCVFHLEHEPLHWIFSLDFSSIALHKIIELIEQ